MGYASTLPHPFAQFALNTRHAKTIPRPFTENVSPHFYFFIETDALSLSPSTINSNVFINSLPQIPTLGINENYTTTLPDSMPYTYSVGAGFQIGAQGVDLSLLYNNYTVNGQRTEMYVTPPIEQLLNQQPYQYQVANLIALLNYTYTVPLSRYVQPFITVGAGLAQVSTSQFMETSSAQNDIAYFTNENFSNTSQFNFAYDASVGLKFLLLQHLNVLIGYRYLNAGKATTGTGSAFASGQDQTITLAPFSTSNLFSGGYIRLMYQF
jgi:opacity protein-like surface antigen